MNYEDPPRNRQTGAWFWMIFLIFIATFIVYKVTRKESHNVWDNETVSKATREPKLYRQFEHKFHIYPEK